ncbi:MAG: RNA polymerase sigma factor [Paramuribaculum sp.]|nr:RNA polymerase sigma factor [Paramuribaculum sp.]
MKKDRLTYAFLALRDKLHLSALALLKNDEDARDAVQDTYINLWKSGSVDTDAEARGKLFAVLRHLCIDRLRMTRGLVHIDTVKDTVSVAPDNIEDLDKFERHLSDGLTRRQIQIYSCIVHEGMEYEEIASRLGITVEAVRMSMSRARKKIRDNYNNLNK